MRPYAVIMPVHIVGMACSVAVSGMVVMVSNVPTVSLLLPEKPASYVGDFPCCIIEANGKNSGRIHCSVDRFDDWRPRSDAAKLMPGGGQLVGRGDVDWSEDTVRYRRLFHRLFVRNERMRAIDGIDRRDHALQPPMGRHGRVYHQIQDARMGQSRCLDHDASKS